MCVQHPTVPATADLRRSQIIYDAIGAGWAFVLLSGIVVIGIPMPLIVLQHGTEWRQRREAKALAKLVANSEKGVL